MVTEVCEVDTLGCRMAATLEATLIYEAFMRANLKKEEEKQLAQNS